ncbi:MAG TPA: 23S rRNA (guanosine(2251)-2'-O)-methyltransferase RlmB [Bacteroidia bacterium]|jgi:23S rRNA (guanosine2251-2'-O)-methyltransferase|nr:23S rRNA (guanosine(2251)-2'-O)-methyltransferase RlmB [Bacteroidia bacterium]
MIQANQKLIFGIHPLIEAIESGKELEKVFIQNNLQGPLAKELQFKLRDLKIPFQYVPMERLNRLTRKNHQGVVAYISDIIYHKIEHLLPSIFEKGKTPLLVMLDEITDVRNMGAIIRTAECTGADAVIIPQKGSAQINEETMKASAGAVNLMPICREPSLAEALHFLKSSGLQVIACTEKTDNPYTKTDYTLPTVIILGSEGSGISSELMKLSDAQVRIPLMGKIESLNVSVSAAVVLYEAVRQRLNK